MNIIHWIGDNQINFTITNILLIIFCIVSNIISFTRTYESTNNNDIRNWEKIRKSLSVLSAIVWIFFLIYTLYNHLVNEKDAVCRIIFLFIVVLFIAKKVNNYIEFKDIYVGMHVRRRNKENH